MFTSGGECVSDNGEADAQRFYSGRRPLEGRIMQTFQPSQATAGGARFDPKNSLVS